MKQSLLVSFVAHFLLLVALALWPRPSMPTITSTVTIQQISIQPPPPVQPEVKVQPPPPKVEPPPPQPEVKPSEQKIARYLEERLNKHLRTPKPVPTRVPTPARREGTPTPVQQKVTPTVTPGLNIQFTRFTDVESVTRPVVGPPSETQAPVEQEVVFEQGFNYQNYVDRLMRTLQRNWDPPAWQPNREEGIYALICFTIRANGMVVNAYIETPSEWKELDESALRAVRRSSPVEPLPSEYGQPSVRAHVRFRPIRR